MKKKRRMIEAFCPSRQFVSNLKVGDKAPDCFGKWREVTDIIDRFEDPSGRLVVNYYTDFGRSAMRLSGFLVENLLHRSIPLKARYSASQLDVMELIMQRNHMEVKVA